MRLHCMSIITFMMMMMMMTIMMIIRIIIIMNVTNDDKINLLLHFNNCPLLNTTPHHNVFQRHRFPLLCFENAFGCFFFLVFQCQIVCLFVLKKYRVFKPLQVRLVRYAHTDIIRLLSCNDWLTSWLVGWLVGLLNGRLAWHYYLS